MYAADEADAPPWALSLAWRCQRWGALPRPGGVLDQDDIEMAAMEMALESYALAGMSMTSKHFNHALYEQLMAMMDDD